MPCVFAALIVQFANLTYSPVLTAGEYVRKMQKSSPRRIEIDPLLSKHIVMVRSSGRNITVNLQALSVALHASCKQDDNRIVITRTSLDKRSISGSRLGTRLTWLHSKLDAIEKFRELLVKRGTASAQFKFALADESRRMSNFLSKGIAPGTGLFATQLLPPELLLEDLMKKVGLDSIANLKSGKRAEYANFRSDGSVELPSVDEILEKYSNEKVDLRLGSDLDRPHLSLSDSSMFEFVQGPKIKSDKLRLRVVSSAQSVQVRLEGYAADDSRNLFAFFEAGPSLGLETPESISANFGMDKTYPKKHISDLSYKALQEIRNLNSGRGVNSGNFNWIIDPITVDPLSSFVSDIMSNVVEDGDTGFNVVDLSDGLWTLLFRSVDKDGQYSVEAVRQCIKMWLPYEKIQTPDFTAWRPIDAEFEDLRRADRKVLKNYARSKEKLTMRTAGQFIHRAVSADSSVPFAWLAACTQNGKPTPSMLNVPWEYYDLVGAISDTGWNELLQGKRVSVEDLGISDQFDRLIKTQEPDRADQLPDRQKYIPDLYVDSKVSQSLMSVQSGRIPLFKLSSQSWGWSDLEMFSKRFKANFERKEDGTNGPLEVEASFVGRYATTSVDYGSSVGTRLKFFLPYSQTLTREIIEQSEPDASSTTFSKLPADVLDQIWNYAKARADESQRNVQTFKSIGAKGKIKP